MTRLVGPRRGRFAPAAVAVAAVGVAVVALLALVLAPPRPSATEPPAGTLRPTASATPIRSPEPAPNSPAASARASPGGASPGAGQYRNPVLDADFPDPTILKAPDGWYYAYATQTETDRGIVNIQVARSRDLVRWTLLGDALPRKPRWASNTQDFWAPHVVRRGSRYVMYYSANPNTGDGLCLAVATASRPRGPFTDIGRPLQCGPEFVNIDPMAFEDPATGKHLLYWGSGFQPIKVRELAANGLGWAAGSQVTDLVEPNGANEYENLVEGAWVVRREGWYFLFYSGDACCGPSAHYAVMVARSRSATGPFEKLADARGTYDGTILVANEAWTAPGHNAVLTDSAGTDWLVYHAIDPDNPSLDPNNPDVSRRPMLFDRIDYRDGWPAIGNGTPSTGPQEAPRP